MMELGSTFSGVFIQRRMVGVKATPSTVRTTPATRPKATSVCTARDTPRSSLAPKYLAMTTPAPMAMPLKKPTIMKIRLPDEVTAARAASSRNLPTIRASAVLYICWKMLPNRMGSAKNSSFFQMTPSVRAFRSVCTSFPPKILSSFPRRFSFTYNTPVCKSQDSPGGKTGQKKEML